MRVKSIVAPLRLNTFNCLTKLNKTMNKTFVVGVTALLLAVCMPCASARKLAHSKAPKAEQSDIVFTVANQQFMITEQSFDLSLSVTSGAPNQIRIEPTQAAKDSGFVVSSDWSAFEADSVSHFSIPRPNRIKPGDYACALSIRDSLQPESEVSASFVITIEQISFEMERTLIVCGEDNDVVTIELRNIKGDPNTVKLLVLDSVLRHSGIIREIDMPFDKSKPYLDIDLSRVGVGVSYSDMVQVALVNEDPTMLDTIEVVDYLTIVTRDTLLDFTIISTPAGTVEVTHTDSLFFESDSIRIDSSKVEREIHVGDTLFVDENDTILAEVDSIIYHADTIHLAGELDSVRVIVEDSVIYDIAYAVNDSTQALRVDSIIAENDTVINGVEYHAGDLIRLDSVMVDTVLVDTLSEIPAEYIIESVVVDSTQQTTVLKEVDIIWAAHNFAVLGRGVEDDFLDTKFDNCLIFVDNSGRQAGAPIFTSYQWYKDGVRINGATEQYYYETDGNGNLLPLNGSYSVVVTTSDGYTNTLCPMYFNGQRQVIERKSSIVYPNPAENGIQPTLHVFMSESELNESVLRIYDLKGELAYILVGLSEYNTLPSLPANMYVILLESPAQTESIKFIVK